ncbi:MAG: hypothetical protein HY815_17985 [Candidatus Riflebacteria bacterium]|nr:hypothetical protein [Candidatus Riflebacteria bacterium]
MNRVCVMLAVGALLLSGSSRSARALHRSDLMEVRALADDLCVFAHRVRDVAQAHRQEVPPSEMWLERAIHRFARSARRFRDTIGDFFTNYDDIRQTRAMLDENARTVDRHIRQARGFEAAMQDWDRCLRLMDRINDRMRSLEIATYGGEGRRWNHREGMRYRRNGDWHFRDGRWIRVESDEPTRRLIRRVITHQILHGEGTER